MDEFKARQLAQMHFGISDFLEGRISLDILLFRLEGAARAVGPDFWEQEVFATALDLEQISAEMIEERRGLTPAEKLEVESLIARLETRLKRVG